MKTTTITTVGTSIVGKFKKDYPDLHKLFIEKKYEQAADKICTLPAEVFRRFSAEINSTISMIESGIIDPVNLFLIASDTETGKGAADLLKIIFTERETPCRFKNCSVITVKELSDRNFVSFKQHGLKNFISSVCGLIRQYQGGIAINNTGGYKAEIAYAGIIGQAFNVPVYYQHEKFESMIELPPVPVSVNMPLWVENIELFLELKNFEMISAGGPGLNVSPALQQIIESVSVDGREYIALTPAGYLFIQACEYAIEKSGLMKKYELPEDSTSASLKDVSLAGDHHGNSLLMDFARKLCRSPYVKRVVTSLPFEPRTGKTVKRIVKKGPSWFVDMVMTETDAGYSLRAETTARTEEEARWVAARLSAEQF